MGKKQWKKYMLTAEMILFLFAAILTFREASVIYRNNSGAKPSAGMTNEDPAPQDSEKSQTGEEKDYIKWVDFHVTCEAMRQACAYDVESYGQEGHVNWVDLLAYLGAKYGGDFKQYREKDMEEIAGKLQSGETTVEKLSSEITSFDYYREAYGAVLDGLVGEYEVSESTGEQESEVMQGQPGNQGRTGDKQNTVWTKKYGLKGFSPIAKSFPYNDYDDFGVARSYGYRREHLGHDMMGQTGTPVVSVESGYVSAMGWNQYGGWRLGISSFDGKRYYYYAHLRQNFPYCKSLEVGSIVQAGDVIGYMGRTGYSAKENVNNIDTTHLHFGLQLIFDESQREGNHEIWVDVYELVKFLYKNQSEVVRDDATKEWSRVREIKDPAAEEYKKTESGKAPDKQVSSRFLHQARNLARITSAYT